MSKYQRGTDLPGCPTCNYHERILDDASGGIWDTWETWTFICNASSADTCPREQAVAAEVNGEGADHA